MASQQHPVVKNIEELIGKISKGNTEIVSQVTHFLSQLSASKINFKDLMSLEKKMLTDTVNQFINLNTKYTSDLIDILVGVSRQLNQDLYKTNGFNQAVPQQPAAPAAVFEINTSASAGGTANTAFLLTSAKTEPIKCQVKYSEFVMDGNSANLFNADITFDPQSFELQQNVAKKISTLIKVPATAAPGTYRNKVTVDGFEDTFFEIVLNVTAAKIAKETPPVNIVATKKAPAKVTKQAAAPKKAAPKKATKKKATPKKVTQKKTPPAAKAN